MCEETRTHGFVTAEGGVTLPPTVSTSTQLPSRDWEFGCPRKVTSLTRVLRRTHWASECGVRRFVIYSILALICGLLVPVSLFQRNDANTKKI